MAFDASDIRVAGDTRIWVGAVGAAAPALGAPPGVGWTDLGFVTEDGVTFSFGRDTTDIRAMQSLDPVRTITTGMPKTVAFELMQQGREQFLIAMGGGAWAAGTGDDAGVFTYTPPTASETLARALLIDMVDGDANYRWVFKRCQNSEGVESTYSRSEAAIYPVTMSVLTPADNSAPYTLTTDDDAYAAA